MRRGYELTDEADADLLDIGAYIARDSLDAAFHFVDRIHAALARLAENPLIGRARDDLAPSLRGFVVRDHVIFYRMEADRILVIRVRHGARDMERIFRG